jgi:TldD protein
MPLPHRSAPHADPARLGAALTTSRRALMSGIAGGVGLLSLPASLAGCAKPGGLAALDLTSPFPELDHALLSRLLSTLSARGATGADVYAQRARRNRLRLEDGIISSASTTIDQGVGLRALLGDKAGYAFTEDLSPAALEAAARTAASIANSAPAQAAPQAFQVGAPDRHYRLALPWAEVGVDQKLPLIQRVEAIAKGLDPRVSRVSITWSDDDESVLLATLDGRVMVDRRPMTRLWVEVTATQGGRSYSNSSNVAGREGLAWYTEDRLQQVAREAVERTLVLFDARRPPAGELPVVLAAGASGILLHEAIGHGLEADFNRKKTSIYADMLGKSIAPELVTIVDSAVEPHARGALNVDDEGNEGQRTVLVERGKLVSYIHDATSAKHYGVAPTGNGRRESFRHVPLPRMRCTFMEDGPHSVDEIIASVQRGIIAETFTNGQVQIGAGDFTFYIKNGWMIEGGKRAYPIKDVNIIGNGPEALRRVSMAANDGRLDSGGWTCGKDGQSVPVSQGLPTVRVDRLTVGGESV